MVETQSNMSDPTQTGAMPSVMNPKSNGLQSAPGSTKVTNNGSNPLLGQPNTYSTNQVEQLHIGKKDKSGTVKLISIIILSLTTVTFIGLFIWIFLQYNDLNADIDSKIDVAVSEAKARQKMEDETEYSEREKNPYRNFAGPTDYGQLSFEYPKTWSLYVAKNAYNGGDFEAYFNPIQVDAPSNNTINALRVSILTRSFESVTAEYQKYLDAKDSNLSVSNITVNGVAANRYIGTIPGTSLNGIIVIFKIRDKTALLRTDSMLFENDFNTLINTIKFNA